ncbi:MAG: 16S rRNA (guanine(966)-N(2))-methyltransferase RsmD [Coriobacteriia bacterium]|nr:16S rRNA (guanine(966)-N(2))-methyltransferase RsmD [Coriobacteriia bacterium]
MSGVRITGGAWRGRRLEVPRGTTTRPTTDKVRQAIFNSLTSMLGALAELQVLDLYAGSGALSFEALSRGAAHAVMVECDHDARRVIAANAGTLGCEERVEVVAGTLAPARPSAAIGPLMARLPRAADLIFVDPPYDTAPQEVAALLTDIASTRVCAVGALVVYERGVSSAQSTLATFEPPAGFALLREKEYGSTTVSYVQYKGVL